MHIAYDYGSYISAFISFVQIRLIDTPHLPDGEDQYILHM